MLNTIWRLFWYASKSREYPGIHKHLHGLRIEDKLTPEEWIKRRDKRLRQLLIFAGNHVPYYKKVFQQAHFDPESAILPQEMERIPLLTKDLVRENLNDLISNTNKKSLMLENATGGSTGVPLKFYQNLEYQTIAEAIDVNVREWWKILPHDRTALIWGADREFHELSLKERLYEMRQRTKSLNAFRMSDRNLLEFCHMLKQWQPTYLMGYSSALEALARCAKRNKVSDLSFRAIRSTAETLWPQQRNLIEKSLNSTVYNFYGSREINNLAAECPEEKRLHMISTWRFVEIVNVDGRPAPNGGSGQIVVTDLSNYAMPFIRYRNEDIGKMATELCPCGRPSPVIDELLGRSTDLIRTQQGDIIHGEYFTHLFYGRNDIRQFQIHQISYDRVVVRYVPVGKPPNEYMKNVVRKIRSRLGKGTKVEVEIINEIVVPPSGKHRFTISDI